MTLWSPSVRDRLFGAIFVVLASGAPAATTWLVRQGSCQRPVSTCPACIEYFKDGDQVPGRLCTLHRGSVTQQVRRAVEGFFSGLGGRIGRIFGR